MNGAGSGNLHENETIYGLPLMESTGLAASRAAGIVRYGKDQEMVPTMAVWCMLADNRKSQSLKSWNKEAPCCRDENGLLWNEESTTGDCDERFAWG